MDECRVTIANTGASFSCGRGETILDAALRQGVTLPHNCRGGACGQCKADVVEGTVEHGWVMSFAITEEEKEEGQCLVCVSKPLGDAVTVSMHNPVPGADAQPIAPMTTRALVVSSVPLTPQIREITLALDPDCGFRFHAGMHVELGEEAGDGGRPYSIATVPGADGAPPLGLLTVQVTLQPGGRTSSWLHENARVGTELVLRGPYGTFGCDRAVAETDGLLMLAGGTGLAPLLSIAGDLLASGFAAPLELGLSVRTAADLFGVGELERLARAHANLRYWAALTRQEGEPPAAYCRAARVPDLLRGRAAELSGRHVLVAGPPGFVEACRGALAALGVPAERVAAESYDNRAAHLRAAD